MKALTAHEILLEEAGTLNLSYKSAVAAMERYRDQELAIQREFHKKQLEQEYIKGWNDSLNHYDINRI